MTDVATPPRTLDTPHAGPSGVRRLRDVHNSGAGLASRIGDGATGLIARFAFVAVLMLYYLNSALTKVGDGFPGMLLPTDNAYFQIVPPLIEAADYDASQVGFLGDLLVYAGTYAEFVLPVLILVGLFTRLAALGMIGFVIVQSVVDILFHQVGPETVGALFDRFSDSVILDQRTLWVALLLILALKGAGWLSLDRVFGIE